MDSEIVPILREIRDEARQTNARLDQVNEKLDQTVGRLDQTNEKVDQIVGRLDHTNLRLGSMETVLLELAEQQRFVVRYLHGLSERDRRLEDDVAELRGRVDKLEARLEPE